MEDVVLRLEAVAGRLERLAAGGGAAEVDPEVPPEGWVALNEIYNSTFQDFLLGWTVALDGSYDADNAELAPNQVKKAFECILEYLSKQNKCKKPNQAEMGESLAPLNEAQKAMEKLTRTRNKKLRKFDDHHIIALRIVEALFFVAHYPPSLPALHFESCADSCETTLLKFWKKGTDGDKDFRKKALAFFKPIPDLIRKFYKTGVEFSGKESILEASAATAPVKAPADPAKAAEEEEVAPAPEKKKEEKTVDGDAFIAEISKGGAVTAGLKKVKKSQKNKYKKEKVKGTVSVGPKKAKIKKQKESRVKKAGPYTWQFLDFQNKELEEIDDPAKYDIKKQLYFADCINSNFKICNRVKTVTLDSCKRVNIQVDQPVLSMIELINCKNVTIYCMDTCPTIQMDKCDSPSIFLGKKAWADLPEDKKPQILYGMVSGGNITFCSEEEDKEVPIPEQFQVLGFDEDGKMKVTLTDHGD